MPATALPDEFDSVTCWNHPSLTSTLTGAVGTTFWAASAGWYFSRSAGCSFFSASLAVPPPQAASTPGASAPIPRVAKATRRLNGRGALDGVTKIKDTGENRATLPRQIGRRARVGKFCRYSLQPSRTGSGTSVMPNTDRTPSRMVRARAITSSLRAVPRLVSANACLVDSRQGASGPPGSGTG